MRTQIKVTDLNLRQWEHLTTKVPVGGREFIPGDSRVCAVFELAPGLNRELHIEMGITEFSTLLLRLRNIERETIAISPEDLPAEMDRIRTEADPARAARDQDDMFTRPEGADQ